MSEAKKQSGMDDAHNPRLYTASDDPDRPSLKKHALHIAFITVAFILLFWRVFFLGETLVDVATLNNQLPWGDYAGEQAEHPYNRRDLTDTYVTRDYFVAAAYRDGEVPLWNPYNLTGHPIYADGVTRVFSPFLLFYTFLDVPLGYTVARIVELWLASIFAYLYFGAIGVRPRGGLMGALLFGFSAHSMLHLTGLGWWGGLMWLPLIFLFVDRAANRRGYRNAVWAGVFLAAQFYCGYMPNQIYYVGAILLYYLFFALFGNDLKGRAAPRRRELARSFGLMAITLAVGFGLSAVQWAPVMELLGYSNRRIVPVEVGYIYLPPWYLLTMVFPNLFGTAYDARMVTLFTALNVSHDHSLYLGIAGLLPLAAALYALRKKGVGKLKELVRGADPGRRMVFFAFLLIFALFIMMAAPLYVHMTRFMPVLQTIRVIVRAGVLFLFAASALAAFGTDLILRSDASILTPIRKVWRRLLLAATALVATGVAVSYTLGATGFLLSSDVNPLAGSGYVWFLKRASTLLSEQFTPPNVGILVPLAMLLAIYLLLSLLAKAKVSREVFFTMLVGLLLADLFWNSAQYEKPYPRSAVFPQTKTTELLASLPPGRVLPAPSHMLTNRRVGDTEERGKIIAPPNTLLPYQISTVTGKDQLFPKSYREFCTLVEPQPYLSHVVFDQTSSRFLDLLNVRYILTHDWQPPPPGGRWLATEEGVAVYEKDSVLPRAFFVEEAVTARVREDAMALLRQPDFDPAKTAVIEPVSGDPAPSQSPQPGAGQDMAATVMMSETRRNKVVIETKNDRDAFLILSDNYYPGWRASIDGQPATIYRANHTMRAVRVPAGRHVITYVFAPRVLLSAAYVSAATAFVALLALVLGRGRKRESGR